MNTKKIDALLNDPNIFEINRLKPRTYGLYASKDSMSLNGQYDFLFYGKLSNRLNDYDDYEQNQYTKIEVPSNVELCGFGDLQYVNTQYPWDGVEDIEVGFSPKEKNYGFIYKKTFNYEEKNTGRTILSFEGVESCFLVSLNGEFVGFAKDSFTTSEFDITNYLKLGSNELIIEVFKYSSTSFLDDQDFWRLSGIFRDVNIYFENENAIIDYKISYDLDIEDKQVVGKIEFERIGQFETKVEIFNERLESLFSQKSKDYIEFKLDNLSLWSAEVPTLYTIKISYEDKELIKKIGFRKIEIKENVMLFNGKKINFKGVNRHEFSSTRGRAITLDEIRYDLELLKENNFNAIRTSHYPNNVKFYDMCDEIGFYVIDEANLETHGTWSICDVVEKVESKILPNDNQDYYEAVKDRMLNMYERDKNSTSIIIWSLGNESFGGKTLFDMHNLFLQLDNSRLCHYEGTTWDRRFDETSQIESQMYTHSEDVQQQIDEVKYNKPFILCEFSHAMGNSNGNFHYYVDLEKNNIQYNGGFIWEFMDQSIKFEGKDMYGGDFGDYPNDYNFICDGLVGSEREVTSELEYIKNLWSPISVKSDNKKVIVRNENLFKKYLDLKIELMESAITGNKLLKTFNIDIAPEEEFVFEMDNGLQQYVVISEEDHIIKMQGISNVKVEYDTKDNASNIRFVDGNLNFGLHSDDFSITFSKVHGNISQIKYDNENFFDDTTATISPNFWRAPTNNDIGAGKHIEYSSHHTISYFFKSKITDYQYAEGNLKVCVEFTNPSFPEYKSLVIYNVEQNGTVNVNMKSEGIKESFNYGMKAVLNKNITGYDYFGNGPFDSHIDRKEEMVKSLYNIQISNQMQYVFPQEYGNKTDVDYVCMKLNDALFKLKMENYEFSLKPYSDNTLTNTRHKWKLNEELPFMRINKVQAGVAGDDSWGSWVKEEYKAKINGDFEFSIFR